MNSNSINIVFISVVLSFDFNFAQITPIVVSIMSNYSKYMHIYIYLLYFVGVLWIVFSLTK